MNSYPKEKGRSTVSNKKDTSKSDSVLNIEDQEVVNDLGELVPSDNLTINDFFDSIVKEFKEVDFLGINNLSPRDKIKEHHHTYGIVSSVCEIIKSYKIKIGLEKSTNKCYCFNGRYWEIISEVLIEKMLLECAKKSGIEQAKAVSSRFINILLKDFFVQNKTPIPRDSTPKKKYSVINLLNGTLEIHFNGTVKLRGFRSEEFIKYQLPYKYDEEADCPMFKRYLSEVVDDDLSKIILEFIGYCLVPNSEIKEDVCLMLLGSGSNGKSVLMEIIEALLGKQNITTYSLADLSDTRSFYRQDISDKFLNIESEFKTPNKRDLGEFKKLTAGEPTQADIKNNNPIRIENYCRFMFNCNKYPEVTEDTVGFFRRFLIIPFKKTIPRDKRDINLSKKIIGNELPGIINLVTKALLRLKEFRFSYSEESEKALLEFINGSSSINIFLDENKFKGKISCNEIYYLYKEYCISSSLKPKGKVNFYRSLESRGFEKKRDGKGYYFLI